MTWSIYLEATEDEKLYIVSLNCKCLDSLDSQAVTVKHHKSLPPIIHHFMRA